MNRQRSALKTFLLAAPLAAPGWAYAHDAREAADLAALLHFVQSPDHF